MDKQGDVAGNASLADLQGDGAPTDPPPGDVLARAGITSDAWLRHLNVSDYVVEARDPSLKTRMQVIRHFAEVGIKRGLALSHDQRFDAAFAEEVNPRLQGLPPPDAYLAWINAGAATQANAAMFLRGLGLGDLSGFPAGFDADTYLAMNPDLRPSIQGRWAALRHVIEHGLPDGRPGCPINRGTCEIYRASADRQSMRNRLKKARTLYEAVLAEDPRHVAANRRYADCLLRQEEYSLAASVYETLIAQGGDNVWTHINLATCHTKLGRWADACGLMQRLAAARGGDRAVLRRYRDLLRQAYDALVADSPAEACALLAAPLAPTMLTPARAAAPIRSVAIIADLGVPRANTARVDQKLEQFSAAGIACEAIDYRDDIIGFIRRAVWAGAVIFHGVPATPDVMWAIWLLRQAGVPTFFELDSPARDSDAGQIDMDCRLAATMAACDYALAATPDLAAAMEPHVVGRRAFVHRNGLSRLHQDSALPARAAPHGDKIRIFYGSGAGVESHGFDPVLAAPLARLFKTWGPRVELLAIGQSVLPPSLLPYASRILLHPAVLDPRTYWSVLQEADIALCLPMPGQAAETLWMEAAMLAVPSVVSATDTIRGVIEDGRTGILVETADGWFGALDMLVADAGRRQAMGQAARNAVQERHGRHALATNLTDILNTVTKPQAPARTRILVVHVFYPPQSVGGATRVVADNVRDITARYGSEFEFQVFTTLEGEGEPYVPLVSMVDGVRVTAIPTPQEPELDKRVRDETMQAAFKAVLDAFRPDLVHLHCIQRITPSVCGALQQRSVPYVVTVHDGWWISDAQFLVDEFGRPTPYAFADPVQELRRGNAARLERMKIKQASLAAAARVLAVSEPFAALYRACGFTNVITIANGVPDLAALPRLPSPDGRVRMAHIGGTGFHKGYHLVRAALSQGAFPNLHLLVIDHAMDPGAVRHATWGDTGVTFRGKFSQTKMAELYQGINVLLAPSVWPESYGLVAREAAQAGCWVVASDRGAIGQDVRPENGFVIDVSDSAALSGVFAELNANPAHYQERVPHRKLRTAADQAAELADLYRTLSAVVPAGKSTETKPARKARRAA
jgi:glycosyltransferase involved in cell wall biosynthesis/tetratricopeptide (TPR) repeat protein